MLKVILSFLYKKQAHNARRQTASATLARIVIGRTYFLADSFILFQTWLPRSFLIGVYASQDQPPSSLRRLPALALV
jgi:hypothetical protein